MTAGTGATVHRCGHGVEWDEGDLCPCQACLDATAVQATRVSVSAANPYAAIDLAEREDLDAQLYGRRETKLVREKPKENPRKEPSARQKAKAKAKRKAAKRARKKGRK